MVLRGKKSTKPIDERPRKGQLISFVAPIIGSNPLMGFFYGLGGTGAMFIGEPGTTSISNMSTSVLFTTRNQVIANMRGTIMTANNKWQLLTDIKYADFTENTYGLGSDFAQPINDSWNIGGIQTAGLSGSQPLKYKQVRFHVTALKELIDNVYAGIGYHLDYHYDIADLALDLAAPEPVITSHFAYNSITKFDLSKYLTSATSFNFVYDSRDHTVNPYEGAFLQFSYRVGTENMGSDQNSQQLYVESRYYKPLDKSRPRHQIGFWGIGHFVTKGNLPYLQLPANASDMRNRIGRGYVAGRFRGTQWVTLDSEYRFPISSNGLFGGVLFFGGTTLSRPAVNLGTEVIPKLALFDAIRLAGGFGARMMLNRLGRLNLGLDFAFGEHGSRGFYFAVGETF